MCAFVVISPCCCDSFSKSFRCRCHVALLLRFFFQSFIIYINRSLAACAGKGAEAAHLALPLLHLWRDVMDENERDHRVILRVLECSWEMESILLDNRDLLKYPTALADKLLEFALEYCQCVSFLCTEFHKRDGPPGRFFNFTIKYHELLHCADFSRYLSPSRCWTYQGEDQQFRLRRLVARCCTRVPKHKVPAEALRRYYKGLTLHLSDANLFV